MMNYIDETFIDLATLEAGNLFFSIIMKAKICKNMDNSTIVFELLNGKKELRNLKEFYEERGYIDFDQPGVELFKTLDESYEKLSKPYTSGTIFTEQALKKYDMFKSYHLFMNEEESVALLQGKIRDYLEMVTLPYIEKTNKPNQKKYK